MTKAEIYAAIKEKKSFLCVGLDTDLNKIPQHLRDAEDPIFAFNKAIIDATAPYTVSYKINTAFYEAMGLKGWEALEKTLNYIPKAIFTIADAKRGDIGNTADQYAKTFFQTYPFDSVTVAPYMGKDSVQPFLQYPGKFAIVLALTSNPGSEDFQQQSCGTQKLYETVLQQVASWGTAENTMFVVGATRIEFLDRVRALVPEHFLLVPGVGTQGGDLKAVAAAALNNECGLLVNVSRAVIYADNSEHFAAAAANAAKQYQEEMAVLLAEHQIL